MRNFSKLAACVFAFANGACTGDLIALPSERDLGGIAPVDLSNAGSASSDAGAAPPKFFPDIEADLDAQATACSQCHASGTPAPTFKSKPMTTADMDTNYSNFQSVAMDFKIAGDPTSSKLLELMLVGSGSGHPVSPLPSKTSPIYLRWLAWIRAGGPR